MSQSEIIIVDDDLEDQGLLLLASKKCGVDNKIVQLTDGEQLISYLRKTDNAPLLIICAINLPVNDGFKIRERLTQDKELRYKSVPFIFWSELATEDQIQHAYDIPAQGFFVKPGNFESLCDEFSTIVKYWNKSKHPKPLN